MVIFDFVEALRAARNWKAVMARASQLSVYRGINELLQELHAAKHALSIVTKSPDMVPHAFIKHHKWPIDIVIGYHQVTRRKPDPQGLLLAMKKAGAAPETTFHVGDEPDDTVASRGAGVLALGAGWGLSDVAALRESRPDQLFMSVAALRVFLLTS